MFTSVYGGWSRLQKTADSPQLQFIFDRRHPLRTAVADFHGPDSSEPVEFPQLQLVWVIDVPGMQVVQVSVVARCVQRQVPSQLLSSTRSSSSLS